jgi:hypothetical protein
VTAIDEIRSVALGAVTRLERWVRANGWAGFDPHDVKGKPLFMYLLKPHASLVRRVVRKPILSLEANYPRLARKLFGVKPTVNAKGMGLFARGYLQLFAATGEVAYRRKAEECLEWLLANTSRGYDEPCWGYPFDWQSGVVTPAGTPASVVTSAVGDAFWHAWKILEVRRYLEVCEGICRFSLKHLKQDSMADGTLCFSYTPLDDFHVHNANLLVAEFLARVGRETQRQDWVDTGIAAGRYALVEQNVDGSIYYWGRIQNYYNPKIIDHYHSGFEIRCLHGLWKHTGRDDFRVATKSYYAFYLRNLIERRGDVAAPRMYPKSFYPVNIHSCAEALLIATQLKDDFAEARELAAPLLKWIVSNMQRDDGAFIYMIRRAFGREKRITIPYIRWGQGWMMLALSSCVVAGSAQRATSGAPALAEVE